MGPPVDERALAELLEGVADGRTPPAEALQRLRDLPYERLPFALVDHHRELRTGLAEAVYAPGKTPEQVRDIAVALASRPGGAVLVTRATPDQAAAVRGALPEAEHDERTGLVVVRSAEPTGGSVAIVTAGTADLPVAEEAARTAEALGLEVGRVNDVGVAGVHRLLDHRGELEAVDCLVVVAGMEGALASAVAGLTSRPVVAVPTSVGYGAAFEGLAALLAMLASCAPGVVVVNIDNGFGAAQAAARIVHVAGSAATGIRRRPIGRAAQA
jgi:hypothetical protein